MMGTPHYLKVAAAAAIVSLVGCSALSAESQTAIAVAGNGGTITIPVPSNAVEYPSAPEAQEAAYHEAPEACADRAKSHGLRRESLGWAG